MTKSQGSAPTPREDYSASRSFFGQPIVVRVRDLNWQPPAPAPAEETWVSSLLGEDLPETSSTESLLEGVDKSVFGVTTSVDSVTPALSPVPAAVTASSLSDSAPSANNAAAPSYLHRTAQPRDQRRGMVLSGQWLNRLYMGGMAVSLLVASYWVLSSGGSSEETTNNVPEDLFANTSLDEAPPWSGLEPSLTPHESITVQPQETNVPQMASLPERASTGAPRNPAEVELTTIHPAYAGLPSSPPTEYNPAWSDTNSVPSVQDDGYIPSFGPSSTADSLAGDYEASYSRGVPTGNNLPSFDPNPAGHAASSAPGGASEHRTGYPATGSSNASAEHWMLSNGREQGEDTRSANPAARSESQYTQVIHGNPTGGSMPQIHTPPRVAESTPGYQLPQGNAEFGYGPPSDSYADPYSREDSFPRSASRTGLTGGIETFSETR